jgi:hypothetical protein
LVGAGASASAQTTCLTGEDKWHQFVANSEAVSIVVNSTSNDIVIELQTAAGVLIAQENAVAGLGGEILNQSGLTAGQVYTLYVNGVVQQTITGYSYAGMAPGLLCIGVFGTSRYEPYQGKIDISKIYNRAISSAEVTQNYNKYKTRFNLS